ncbi:MAG TPA: glycosyltransferase family 4 protein [Gaiellales bacterium]|jgi:glycosyltransferase involved in cell wall biosynthesis|nr:glycosyltransferase family 4 protein [Gaiellales bacterium]
MRILIVCDFHFKYGSQQARSLVRAGHDVAMLFRSHALEFGGSTAERDGLLESLRREDIKLFVVPGRIRSVSSVPDMLRLRRELHRWRPQVVHVHENHDPRLLALTSGYRTVFTVHDPVEHLGARSFTRTETWIFKRWFRRSQRFVVHGQALADELAPVVGRARIVVIPHPTWPRSQPLPPPRSPSVLLFGRLEQYKGVEVLVEAMRVLWERRPDVKLVVAGTGPAARLVPADPRISLRARYIPEDEIGMLLAGASLVVLPYTQASQSGVGLLAIGDGVPLVVSDLGSLSDLAYEPSFVCEHGNPRALAETILRHLDDGPDVRRAVLMHARCHFSWEHAAKLTTDMYRELAGDTPMVESGG